MGTGLGMETGLCMGTGMGTGMGTFEMLAPIIATIRQIANSNKKHKQKYAVLRLANVAGLSRYVSSFQNIQLNQLFITPILRQV